MEDELAADIVDCDRFTLPELTAQDFHRERIEHFFLDETLEWTGPEYRIVAAVGEPFLRAWGQQDGDLAVGQTFADVRKLDVDDLAELFAAQCRKDHRLVDPVQKLRPEVRP